MLAEYFTKVILKGNNFPFLLKIILLLIVFKRNILSKKYGNFKNYENIEKNIKYNINKEAFDFSKRKNGISLFARLKNSADLLEIAIESHIDFYDEIILVDNNSIDNTREICKKMRYKYPDKIKYYEYNEEVVTYGAPNRNKIPENSVHSMVYYYNWTLSKTTYKYVAKLDDDIVVMDKKLIKEKTNYIRKNGINYLQIIPQINVHISKGKLVTPLKGPTSNILPLIAGIYCDHGIFPISENTYFIKGPQVESFIFPFRYRISNLGFFHLKGLKKKLGAFNQKGEVARIIMDINDNSTYIPLPEEYKTQLAKWVDIKGYQ
ncbi:MAG: glycosyltransferase [Candidatus Gracilibacteria bacterium]|nr:glycosyltransferase [Candidatus Gracilibacteria bacterium]